MTDRRLRYVDLSTETSEEEDTDSSDVDNPISIGSSVYIQPLEEGLPSNCIVIV